MNFTQLVNAVITETVRPDLGLVSAGGDGRIPQAVQASTLKMHTIDGEFFFKDIQATQVNFDTAAYIQVLDLDALPFYRSMAVMRKNDPSLLPYQLNPLLLTPLSLTNGIPQSPLITMGKIDIIDIDDYLDTYGVEKVDVGYAAGSSFYIKSSTPLQYLLMGYYKYPNITADDLIFDSWIARELPFAIVFDATSAILQKIGMTDAARKYDNSDPTNPGLVTAQIQLLRKSNVTPRGY